MIKTITATDAESFDKAVNEFETTCCFSTGVSKVYATQTHVIRTEGMPTLYIAVLFYRGGTK